VQPKYGFAEQFSQLKIIKENRQNLYRRYQRTDPLTLLNLYQDKDLDQNPDHDTLWEQSFSCIQSYHEEQNEEGEAFLEVYECSCTPFIGF
jgi:hypothetical protein